MPTLKIIQNTVCPSLPYIFKRVLSINNITVLDSIIASDIGSIAAGASVDDLVNMNPEVILAFSSIAINNLPASTINSIPVLPLASLMTLMTNTQLNFLSNSPYYSQFSDSVKANIVFLTSGQIITTSSSGSDSLKLNNLIYLLTTTLLMIQLKY